MIDEQHQGQADKRNPWTILGRHVGTATGWDSWDDDSLLLYDFVPEDGVAIPEGDVVFSFMEGVWKTYTDAGIVSAHGDLVETLKDVPVTNA